MNRNWNKDWRKSIIVMSGGFDPIHKGHLRMFREASWLGHHVVVGLNSDEWLTRKKGKPFMNFEERKEIIEGFKYVNQVLPFDDSDDTASDLIRRVHNIYDSEEFEHNYEDTGHQGMVDYYQIYFANGGDRGKGNVPELGVCKDLGVTMLWGVGGGKIQSSSWLINGGKDDEV
tara:strand:- start:375 stop:893 length:519 start_codon:yes stop_codon:yes gene_type:complete